MTRTISSAVAAALLLLLLSVSSVAAHAELEESDPADGATIETPFTLTATFSEEFSADPERSFIRVQDSAGDVVASGAQSEDDPTVMTAELPALDPGEYTVRWQTTTEDDQGVERGTFTFTVAATATPSPSPTSSPTSRASTPPASASPTSTPPATSIPSPVPTATPSGNGGQPTAGSNDILIALLVGVAIVGVLAFFLVRRTARP